MKTATLRQMSPKFLIGMLQKEMLPIHIVFDNDCYSTITSTKLYTYHRPGQASIYETKYWKYIK